MNRRPIARLILSLLLVLQLVTIVTVHAASTHSAMAAAAMADHAHHCATMTDHAAASGHHETASSHMHSGRHSTTAKSACCTQAVCAGDCAGAAFVGATPFDASRVIPESPGVLGFAAPAIETRAFQFFRPPI